MTKLPLSDKWLAERQAPGEVADAIVPALKVRVGKSGVKTFSAVRWRSGKAERITFGRYPKIELLKARLRADAFANGKDVVEDRAEGDGSALHTPPRSSVDSHLAVDLPVTALFEDYVTRMKRRGQPTARDYESAFYGGERSFVTYLVRRYGRVPTASQVTSDDAACWLRERQKTAKFHAHYLRGHLHAAFQWGLQRKHDFSGEARDYGLVFNPIAAIPTGRKAPPRDRVLSIEELRTLWRALEPVNAGHRVLKLMIAMGGLRVSEISASQKAWWSGASGTLRLPRTKNGRPHEVPITETAKPELDLCRRLVSAASPFLFPNAADPKQPVTLNTVSKAAWTLHEEIPLEPFTPRDLRRTMKTHLIETGVDERWLDIWHNHGQTADVARRHYIRAEYTKVKREVAEAIDGFLREQVIPGEGGDATSESARGGSAR